MNNFLDNIKKTKISTEPFDHMIIDNLLSNEFYLELSKEVNEFDIDGFNLSSYRGEPLVSDAIDITDYKLFTGDHSRPTVKEHNNYNLLSSKGLHKIKSFVDMLLGNHKELHSILGSRLPTDRLQEDYFFHISMIRDRAHYTIDPHPDSSCNIFTMLFYVPETNVNKNFGLDVYKTTDRSGEIDEKENLEQANHVNFLPNRMVIFAPWQSWTDGKHRPTTWHGVSKLSDKLTGTRNSFQLFLYKRLS